MGQIHLCGRATAQRWNCKQQGYLLEGGLVSLAGNCQEQQSAVESNAPSKADLIKLMSIGGN